MPIDYVELVVLPTNFGREIPKRTSKNLAVVRKLCGALENAETMGKDWVKIERAERASFAMCTNERVSMRSWASDVIDGESTASASMYDCPPFGTIRFFPNGEAKDEHVRAFANAMYEFACGVVGYGMDMRCVEVLQ